MAFFNQHEISGYRLRVKKGKQKNPCWDRTDKLLRYLQRSQCIPRLDPKLYFHLHVRGAGTLNTFLKTGLNGSTKRLDHVLNRFCEIQQDKYTPKVYSIADFCRKFIQIENYLDRYEEYYYSGPISPAAQAICNRLQVWHPNSYLRKLLPKSIERSIINYAYCIKVLSRIEKSRSKNRFTAQYLLQQCFGRALSNSDLIWSWYTQHFERVPERSWTAWKPDSFYITFSVETKKFKWLLQDNLNSNFGYDEIMNLLREIQIENRKLRRQYGAIHPHRNDSK